MSKHSKQESMVGMIVITTLILVICYMALRSCEAFGVPTPSPTPTPVPQSWSAGLYGNYWILYSSYLQPVRARATTDGRIKIAQGE